MSSSALQDPSGSEMRVEAAGAAVSTLALLGMAFVSLPAGLEYPGLPALTGSRPLSAGDLAAYMSGIRTLFALDGVFLLGWILAWIGLAGLVRRSDPGRAGLVLAFGLVGALMDFGENGIILGALEQLAQGSPAPGAWPVAWKAVQHLSYWLPFGGAFLAAPALWRRGFCGTAAALAGTVLLPVAGAGLYFPELSLASNLWFLVWFACLAGLLWTCAGEGSAPEARKE